MNLKIKLSIIGLLLSLIITKSYASDNCRTDIKNSSYSNLSSSTYNNALDLGEKLHKNFINKSNTIQSDTLGKYVSILSNYKTKYKLEGTKLDIINLLIDQFQCKKEYVLKLDGKESSAVSINNNTVTVQNQNICPTVRNGKTSSYPNCNVSCNYGYTEQNGQCIYKCSVNNYKWDSNGNWVMNNSNGCAGTVSEPNINNYKLSSMPGDYSIKKDPSSYSSGLRRSTCTTGTIKKTYGNFEMTFCNTNEYKNCQFAHYPATSVWNYNRDFFDLDKPIIKIRSLDGKYHQTVQWACTFK